MASRGMRVGIGVAAIGVLALGGYLSQSSGRATDARPIRLVDVFKPEMVQGAAPASTQAEPLAAWRFDGAAAEAKEHAATRGWEGHNVSGLAIRDGRLVGRSTTAFPVVAVMRTRHMDNADQVYGFEIRARVSAGTNLSISTAGPAPLNFPRVEALARRLPWTATTPLLAGNELQTYIVTSSVPLNMARAQRVLISPTDAADATFEIESVRMISEREHLASVKSGVGWQGLKDIFRESLVSRAPETLRLDVDVPADGRLEMALGTMEDQPPTFKVTAASGGEPRVLLEHTVTTPHRWEWHSIDLSEYSSRRVTLSLSLAAEKPGTIGLWGTPTVRARTDRAGSAPRGVIMIHADTLRPDHLDLYGHTRSTAPFLSRLAREGATFKQAFAQAGWTKVSTPSFMTSLYPTTHGVHAQPDRLPAAATTAAEVYRAAGYATVSYSSVMFTGLGTNLHQGYEELHERASVDTGPQYLSKTARTYVDRASQWIEEHRDEPFFMYLHVFDPHSPYEPRRPWDALWADASKREEHVRQFDALRKVIANPFMADRGMATRDEMLKAGVDPSAYLAHERDWYDGSIRGLDAELARLFERLHALRLDRDVALVFLSDHGTEFQDHGRMFHGHSAYGELMHVPLVIRWPAGLQGGRVIEEPVQLVDVMPTLLDLSALEHPKGMQGQSLLPLLRPPSDGGSGWKRRPVIMEKQPQGQPEHPSATEAYAIIDGNWKLIHNKVRPEDRPEYELYEFPKDRLDQHDVAAQHPDVVQRLSKALNGWHTMATAARLKPDTETTKALSAEELQRLRSLGYVR